RHGAGLRNQLAAAPSQLDCSQRASTFTSMVACGELICIEARTCWSFTTSTTICPVAVPPCALHWKDHSWRFDVSVMCLYSQSCRESCMESRKVLASRSFSVMQDFS